MPHGNRAGNLSGAARSQGGIPQPGVAQTLQSPEKDVQGLLQALQSGQVPAEKILQFLALLTGGGQGGPPAPGPQGGPPPGAQPPRQVAGPTPGASPAPRQPAGGRPRPRGGGGGGPIAQALGV